MQQKYKSTGQVIINQTHLSNLGNITQRGVITSQKLFICHHLCSQHVTGCHDNPVILLAELLNQPSLTCTWGEEASLTLSRKTCWNVGFTGIHVTRLYLCLNDLLFWSTVKSTIIRKTDFVRILRKCGMNRLYYSSFSWDVIFVWLYKCYYKHKKHSSRDD